MIEITTSSSTKIIKNGDYFSIYVDITNGEADEIKLTNVKLFQPIGFTLAPINKQYTIIDAIKETIKGFFSSSLPYSTLVGGIPESTRYPQDPEAIQNVDELPGTPYVEVSRPTIEQKSDIIIQPKDTYRTDFNLKAGWSGGLRPRPDTYIISGEVEYHIRDKLHYKQINIEVSIFPSLGTMLIGTLIGSSLGTIVNAIIPHIQNNKVPIPGLEIITLQMFANLVIGFVVGITLMRKKDVQPFLTVEDFWGGILLGFLVGYVGQEFYSAFLRIQPS